ncbi:hypothetical protein BDU57DRAFT_527152 [Ampelomyces quisqualis]|uniref:Uncharacterized protein n=1 Tax=Ampelomyces quisqualis TaxID=50730 RepID=A0A6A5QUC0_AMPQU|nr:hypothetical protein BDU57DRAFT_527152 [Ampelomyces quisqualis]
MRAAETLAKPRHMTSYSSSVYHCEDMNEILGWHRLSLESADGNTPLPPRENSHSTQIIDQSVGTRDKAMGVLQTWHFTLFKHRLANNKPKNGISHHLLVHSLHTTISPITWDKCPFPENPHTIHLFFSLTTGDFSPIDTAYVTSLQLLAAGVLESVATTLPNERWNCYRSYHPSEHVASKYEDPKPGFELVAHGQTPMTSIQVPVCVCSRCVSERHADPELTTAARLDSLVPELERVKEGFEKLAETSEERVNFILPGLSKQVERAGTAYFTFKIMSRPCQVPESVEGLSLKLNEIESLVERGGLEREDAQAEHWKKAQIKKSEVDALERQKHYE